MHISLLHQMACLVGALSTLAAHDGQQFHRRDMREVGYNLLNGIGSAIGRIWKRQ